jgi:hypothetical protein
MKFDIYTLLTKGYINPKLKLNKTLHSEILKEISDLDEVHQNWLGAPEKYPNYSCKINDGTLEFSFCDGVLKWYFINIYFKMRSKEISMFQRFYKNDKYLRYNLNELIFFFKKNSVTISADLSDPIDKYIDTEFGIRIIYDAEIDFIARICVLGK